MLGYLAVFAAAALGAFVCTYWVREEATRRGAVVEPDERRIHTRPTPTLGGVGMYVAFLIAMGVAWALPQFRPVFRGSSAPLGVVVGATIILLVGLIDDVREVSPPAKVAGQVLTGAVITLFGVTMLFFRIPFLGAIVMSPDMAPLVTVLWLVVIANAVNLIDGLDGLAAGIVGIASLAFFVYAERRSDAGSITADNIGPLIALITAGVCVGFLPHNFHPARIFMGDTGSMFLGLLMASSTIAVSGQTDDQFSGQTFFFFAPLFIPFVILGVPVIDTIFAIARRARRRVGVSTPDKEHLHHRLIGLGHGQRRAVLILWAWTAMLSALVLFPVVFPSQKNPGNLIVPFGIVAAGIGLYTMFHPGIRRGHADEAPAEAAAGAD